MREGMGTALGAIGLGAVTGALIGSGMKALMEGTREQRQAREEAAYSAAVAAALDDAELLGDIAMRLVSELAAARAENTQLERALEQRQAYIDRMRKS